jgi:glutathione S-transferase
VGCGHSIELVTVPWWLLKISGEADNPLLDWMNQRLAYLEGLLSGREWLAADRFAVADLLMADLLRIPDVRANGHRPASEAYIKRVTSRPAFHKAHADQIAHFAASDKSRPKSE